MLIVLFGFLLLVQKSSGEEGNSILHKFNQHDYKIEMERIELVSYDRRYCKLVNIVTFKYNRTCPAVNVTVNFNVDLDYNVEIVAQVYKFMSNEYRLFPIRLQFNLCKAISENIAGLLQGLKCGTFKGCPLKKGITYHVCNWTIDQYKFPPLIPNGKYMVEVQGFYLGNEIGILHGYATISRPIVAN